MTEPTRISVVLDLDADCWRLYATRYNYTMPAGERLFRAKPYPEILFSHPTEAGARADADKLQA